MKFESLCKSKDTVFQTKLTEWEKRRGLVSEIYKELKKLPSKQANKQKNNTTLK